MNFHKSQYNLRGTCIDDDKKKEGNMKNVDIKILSRYMSRKYLGDLLKNRRLTLLNPDSWEDRNDSETIKLYAKRMQYKVIYVACFTSTSETNHHWHLYGRDDGIRVVFNAEMLIQAAEKSGLCTCKAIEYIKIKEFNEKVKNISQLPFIKRRPYRHEREFRIIRPSRRKSTNDVMYLKIPSQSINTIIVSPWTDDEIVKKIKRDVQGLFKHKINVNRTTLLSNKKWLELAQNVSK